MSMHTARARVVLTVEFACAGSWNDTADVAQITKQAIDDAKGALRTGLAVDGLVSHGGGGKRPATIVGTPRVTVVLIDEATDG